MKFGNSFDFRTFSVCQYVKFLDAVILNFLTWTEISQMSPNKFYSFSVKLETLLVKSQKKDCTGYCAVQEGFWFGLLSQEGK